MFCQIVPPLAWNGTSFNSRLKENISSVQVEEFLRNFFFFLSFSTQKLRRYANGSLFYYSKLMREYIKPLKINTAKNWLATIHNSQKEIPWPFLQEKQREEYLCLISAGTDTPFVGTSQLCAHAEALVISQCGLSSTAAAALTFQEHFSTGPRQALCYRHPQMMYWDTKTEWGILVQVGRQGLSLYAQ